MAVQRVTSITIEGINGEAINVSRDGDRLNLSNAEGATLSVAPDDLRELLRDLFPTKRPRKTKEPTGEPAAEEAASEETSGEEVATLPRSRRRAA